MQNIDEISEHDIIAWTFAQPGAMGCPGEITIITIHGNAMWLYRFSYIQNENLEVEARRRFPNKITKLTIVKKMSFFFILYFSLIY